MAEHTVEHEKHESESLIDKITEKLHDADPSSSDSDGDNDIKSAASAVKSKIYRLFGREKPLHKVLGGGKRKCLAADIFLWRDKKVSAGVLGAATVIWVLFELLEYHLLALVCHILILGLSIVFLWSNTASLIKKSPPRIPEVVFPEDIVIAGLWVLSVLGSCLNFLTLFYVGFLLLHSVPLLYEKYEDQVDAFAEKAEAELKKQYAVFSSKVLSKIPRGPLKDKKFL
ncbi:hypothetical protein SASPL_110770 [Salvia splendens]|uniref:Reticulon-like protein n=1 Tax=Salvia splendens TaxID=180675 RepID=A0A8X8YAL5_SALSN|nr:hypothetical protein SASPL_110770 [Salvia splendens]